MQIDVLRFRHWSGTQKIGFHISATNYLDLVTMNKSLNLFQPLKLRQCFFSLPAIYLVCQLQL